MYMPQNGCHISIPFADQIDIRYEEGIHVAVYSCYKFCLFLQTNCLRIQLISGLCLLQGTTNSPAFRCIWVGQNAKF